MHFLFDIYTKLFKKIKLLFLKQIDLNKPCFRQLFFNGRKIYDEHLLNIGAKYYLYRFYVIQYIFYMYI